VSKKLSRILTRTAVAVISVLITILVLEVALRVFFTQLPVDIAYAIRHVHVTPFGKMRLTDHPNAPLAPLDGIWARWLVGEDRTFDLYPKANVRDVHFELTPHVRFVINTYEWSADDPRVGFRTPPPADGMLDIVALGDSMTFCWTDIEDCWTSQLAEQLGHSVANLGIPGTGALSHANVYQQFVKSRYTPKIVLWQFLFNDPLDDVRIAVGLILCLRVRSRHGYTTIRRPTRSSSILSKPLVRRRSASKCLKKTRSSQSATAK
jgi:hypothetical protein